MKSASGIFYGKCYCLQGDGLDECGVALNKWHELENNKTRGICKIKPDSLAYFTKGRESEAG